MEGAGAEAWMLASTESARALGAPLKHAAVRRVNGADSKRSLHPKPILDLGMLEEFLHRCNLDPNVLYKCIHAM